MQFDLTKSTKTRTPQKGLIFHPDNGTNYTSATLKFGEFYYRRITSEFALYKCIDEFKSFYNTI